MTKIKPFRPLIYNQEKVKDLSEVICPPYDVISKEAQHIYHEKSPYNLIHVLLGKDISGEDKYERAKNIFKSWQKNEILIQEEKPAIYFYIQDYYIRGEKKTRFGIIALLHLEEKKPSIFRHEHTRTEPKEDRTKLLKQVKANLSPIFAVFSDHKRIIQRIYQKHINEDSPFIGVVDQDKTVHKLWRIDSPELLAQIQDSFEGEKIFIADGHHRYEVASAYRDEMRNILGPSNVTGEESFNYILTYFTNTDNRGLLILPIHRLLSLDKPIENDKILSSLEEYFNLDEVKDKMRFFFLLEKGGRSEHVLGMYKDKKYWLLRLKNIRILDKIIPESSKEFKSLDVSILNELILKKILGLRDNEHLTFSPHAQELIEAVDTDTKNIAFFLNPVKIEQIIGVALNQERMPPKSTYFYPKVLSGLLMHKFKDD